MIQKAICFFTVAISYSAIQWLIHWFISQIYMGLLCTGTLVNYKVILHSFPWGAYNLSEKDKYKPKSINFSVEMGVLKYIKIVF